MSGPIRVGDLVMVIKSCCRQNVRAPIFVVADLDYQTDDGETCRYCGAAAPNERAAADHSHGRFFVYPLSWLKRIPPLDELESEKHKEELTA
jgi:hypothetical protein